jgi:hypothetical protein
MLAIVRRLLARGHNVQVLSDLCNQKELEAEGASFACWTGVPRRSDKSAAADPIKDWEVSSPLTLLARLRDRLFVGPALAYARDVLHELERFPANTVVTSEMLLGVMAAAESVGVPCVALSANIYLYPLPGVPRFGPGFQPAKGCPVACGTPWCETSVSVCLEKQRPSSMLPARAGVASTLSPFVLPSVLLPHALPVLDKIVTESPRLRHTLFSCNTYSAIVRRRAFVIRFAPGTKQTKRSPWARIEGVQSAGEITFNLPEELPRLLSFTEAVWAEGSTPSSPEEFTLRSFYSKGE